jgi:hypothetical protein
MSFLSATISSHLLKHQRLIGWARLLAGYSAVQENRLAAGTLIVTDCRQKYEKQIIF